MPVTLREGARAAPRSRGRRDTTPGSRHTGRSGMRIGQIAIDVAPLREGRDFRLLFTGRFVSMAGNAVATTAANWQVYGLTGSSLAVGMLTLADSAGMFAGLLAGGMLADRHDRRTLMLASRVPLAMLAALLMVNSVLSHPALWAVYVLVLLVGALSGLGSPASTAAVPALVGSDRLAAAAALNAMGSRSDPTRDRKSTRLNSSH